MTSFASNEKSAWHRWSIFVAIVCLGMFTMVATASAEPPVVERDRVRITKHLKNVESDLRSRDVSHLSPELQAERERNLDRLHEYWKAGVYPRNTHVPHRQPVFLDRDGRACAVAYLMIESGWDEEAKAISERENLAYLPDMTSPEVGEWVAQSGLTAEEAARIQPTYSSCASGCSCEADPVCGDDGKTYVNSCFAQNCGGVEQWRDGCCMANDEIESVFSSGYGTYPQNCPEDPNNRSEELCPAGSGDVGDAGRDIWQSADDRPPKKDTGCSSTDGDPIAPVGLIIAVFGIWASRRRRARGLE